MKNKGNSIKNLYSEAQLHDADSFVNFVTENLDGRIYNIAIIFEIEQLHKIHALKGCDTANLVLKNVYERLECTLSENFSVYKSSSNKFVSVGFISLEKDKVEIQLLIKQLHCVLTKPYVINKALFHIELAIGYAIKEDKELLKEVISRAEFAINEKEPGPRAKVYNIERCLYEQYESNLLLQNELVTAFNNRQFQVHYQPIVNMNNNSIEMEALIRWNLKGKFIPPSKFLIIIEQMGLMEALTLWITEQVCIDFKKWKRHCDDILKVSINISPSSCNSSFFAKFIEILRNNNVSYEHICLEITENFKINAETREFIEQCSNKGISIAIDDFGTGYSSMGYLIDYPFDVLKIDRSLIQQLDTNQKQLEVAKSIINLANRLNIKVVAEGVETAEQVKILGDLGVEKLQGYYFSQPTSVLGWHSKDLHVLKKVD